VLTVQKDYYVILDLPKVINKKAKQAAPYMNDIFAQYSIIHPRKKERKHRRRTRNAVTGELEYRVEASPKVSGTSKSGEIDQEEPQADNEAEDQSVVNIDEPEQEPSSIQFVDFHGTNPIISFEGNFYSCKWAASIGSDMIFAKRPENQQSHRNSVYSLPSWDLLDIGSARLIASNVQIDRRTANDKLTASAKPTEIQNVENGTPNSAMRQTSFLTKLRDIQVRRGEVDPATARGSLEPRRRRGRPRSRHLRAARVASQASRTEDGRFSLSNPTPTSWDAMDTTET